MCCVIARLVRNLAEVRENEKGSRSRERPQRGYVHFGGCCAALTGLHFRSHTLDDRLTYSIPQAHTAATRLFRAQISP